MSVKDKRIVVTGGSRGLGLGLVEAFVEQGRGVRSGARASRPAAIRSRLSVETISADITDREAAKRILADVRPEILVLNAGTAPPMGPIDQISWEDFTANWNTDVQGTLHWLQAAYVRVWPARPRRNCAIVSVPASRRFSSKSRHDRRRRVFGDSLSPLRVKIRLIMAAEALRNEEAGSIRTELLARHYSRTLQTH
jgi:NAD(P)-dependent dehydrogenase (short-subunit alcohol dehydrogenase family)